jgi:hypothetical protein
MGDKLISDALDYFGRSGVRLIDIRVVEGTKRSISTKSTVFRGV